MSTSLSEGLPESLKSLRTRPLFVLREQVLPLRGASCIRLHMRLVLRTTDGALIVMTYHQCLRVGSPVVIEKSHRGEDVDPGPFFLTQGVWSKTQNDSKGARHETARG